MTEQKIDSDNQTFILVIEIVGAKNIPIRKTKPNPYVSIFYQGKFKIIEIQNLKQP